MIQPYLCQILEIPSLTIIQEVFLVCLFRAAINALCLVGQERFIIPYTYIQITLTYMLQNRWKINSKHPTIDTQLLYSHPKQIRTYGIN
jgi:hypothetical protein